MTDTYVKFRNEVMAGGASDVPGEEQTAGGPKAWLALAVILGLLVALGFYSIWALVFVIGLLVSIFLHELGHFVTARKTGMKVTQFFLFMGPKLFSFRRGETEYGLRAIPLGAFVRIVGMNNLDPVDPEDEPRAYRSKSYPRRMLVITAGSIMHMLIAVVLLFAVYAVNGQRVDQRQGRHRRDRRRLPGRGGRSAGRRHDRVDRRADADERGEHDQHHPQPRARRGDHRRRRPRRAGDHQGGHARHQPRRAGLDRRLPRRQLRRRGRSGVRGRSPTRRSTASATSARTCGPASAASSRCSTR